MSADSGPPARAAGPADLWLAQTLADAGVLTAAQAERARQTEGSSLWKSIVGSGLATDQQILDAISIRFKVPVADLSGIDARVAALLPEHLARKYQVIALGADDRLIRIAAADPRDLALEQTLAFITGREVLLLAAAPDALAQRIEEVYRPEAAVNRLVDGLDPSAVETIDETPAVGASRDPSLDAPMARLVDAMIADAVREGASDIHCEPLAEGTSVRYRLDGVIKEVMRLPASAGPALVRRVKILSRLDVTDPLRPHDGRSAVRVDGKYVDLRVSTVPVARRGEKVVIRILDKANLRASIPDLKLPSEEADLLLRLLGHREGIVLVTGPTGSGKTTTLYAALNQLKTGQVNIVTVEDPVEYDVPGVSQLQVNEAQGFTFASALRSVLRQDPDIVLVGEIRDAETATIATQASLSGHLVLSTLHTNDAASAVTRLRDLGVDGFKIASALKGVVAQRLVRRVCGDCAVAVPVGELPVEFRQPADAARAKHPRKGPGCKACGGTGFKGRLALIEVMPVDEKVAQLIGASALPDALVAAARPAGMRTLWESGLLRVWEGETTPEEIIRVLGDEPSEAHLGRSSTGSDGHLSTVATSLGPPLAAPGAPAAIATAVAPPMAPAPTLGNPGGKTSVLVVDDDRQMRRLIKMMLEREGYLVREAADGLDALDAIDAGPVDLMILDLDMPRLDGVGVLEELRARVMTSGLPVIVLTARTGEAETQVLDLGAQDFLTKPVQPASLSARVRAVLRRTRMQ
ncbi:MAG: ATPase, T2SS/T4P/T4SS family [Gemmatimonadales bacterium]